MDRRPTFSLIVPTRGRPEQLRRFLDSVAATAGHPEQIEVVLVVDVDDPASYGVMHPRLTLRQVVVPSGRTMGELNTAGYQASAGEFVMLLNDDVVVRTRGWDRIALRCLRRFPDGIALFHVNDTLIRDYLCTFPLVSRVFCELAGGICPEGYRRYRIDDHIEDAFNLMAVVGERRAVYLPDVVFEHLNAVDHPEAGRVYESDPEILSVDAELFDELFPARKELALRLLAHIAGGTEPLAAEHRAAFEAITDPFALRTTGRQQVVRLPGAVVRERIGKVAGLWCRALRCARQKGIAGLMGAVGKRLFTAG